MKASAKISQLRKSIGDLRQRLAISDTEIHRLNDYVKSLEQILDARDRDLRRLESPHRERVPAIFFEWKIPTAIVIIGCCLLIGVAAAASHFGW